ncbi:hypothetical protein FHR83_007062 [Actinoplanes campanulatus]|uniref:Uncharacterized protein n=1 Tax=Actinoplanes campanulatus TaxID=113559 RepID=A0A7W5FI65_9ACTN|nr:hypothetical protein [Actinoplanes campanulatus]MBB3099356.1 hypothetical protein [Actinoplanes campanulatus]GGN40330.1 hypothetical protein GCM10010109_69300 [Actinoplanes campanulatus]GID40673.1 hypothetical protein Aca09nite_71790 [Actinoplanes campanulatus]
MNGTQAYRFALANAPRNDDGQAVEKSLVDIVERVIDFDPAEERRKKAQRVVSARKRPGQTAPAGKVALPGLGLFEYEPDRLVADDQGNVIENSRALARHKRAEARRSATNADRAQERAVQDQVEAELMEAWSAAQQKAGRAPGELTFGVYLAETGLLADDAA